MNFLKKILSYAKGHKIISGASLAVLILILIFAVKHGTQKSDNFKAVLGDVVDIVSVTGKTKAVKNVDLAFQYSGTVVRTFVDVGDTVLVGQPLVELDQSEQYASLLRAQSSVKSEQAKLDEMKKGTRPEELSVSQTETSNAEVALSDAGYNLSAKILDAYTKSDDAVHNSIDQLFGNARSSNPSFNLPLSDSQLRNDLVSSRVNTESTLNNWSLYLNSTPSMTVTDVYKNLFIIRDFIDKVATAVNGQYATYSVSQSTIDGYKSSISTARNNIITVINNISTAEQGLNSAKSALALAQKNLLLKKGGSTPEAIASEEAKVMQATADVKSIEAQIYKMTLRSPLHGVVTVQDAKEGEIATSGKSVVSVISDKDLQVEADVSEIRIGKVSVGDPVDISFDAYEGKLFDGKVVFVDPAETLIDGVVNYKVTVAFATSTMGIKSGLTANLKINTDDRKNVLKIPFYSLIKDGNQYFVQKQISSKKFDKVPVSVGLIGGDGFVEVVSGLSVGDVVDISPSQ